MLCKWAGKHPTSLASSIGIIWTSHEIAPDYLLMMGSCCITFSSNFSSPKSVLSSPQKERQSKQEQLHLADVYELRDVYGFQHQKRRLCPRLTLAGMCFYSCFMLSPTPLYHSFVLSQREAEEGNEMATHSSARLCVTVASGLQSTGHQWGFQSLPLSTHILRQSLR